MGAELSRRAEQARSERIQRRVRSAEAPAMGGMTYAKRGTASSPRQVPTARGTTSAGVRGFVCSARILLLGGA